MNAITLLKVETIKARKRFPIVLFTIVLALLALIEALIPYILARHEGKPSPIVFPTIWANIMHGPFSGVLPLFIAILVVSLVASEFVWKTSRQNVIDGLSRNEWFGAKLQITLIFCIIFILETFGIPAIIAALSPFTKFLRFQDVLMFGAVFSTLAGFAALAFFLAITIRKEAGAIGLFIVWGPLETLIAALLEKAHTGWGNVITYLPSHVISENTNPRFWDPEFAARMGPFMQARHLANRPELSWHTNEILTLAYVIVFLGLAYWDYRRRDL